MEHPSIAPAVAPRARGSRTATASGTKKSGARCFDVPCAIMRQMPIIMPQPMCTTLFIGSGIGSRKRNHHRKLPQVGDVVVHALSGQIPGGRSLLKGHPNEGRPGPYANEHTCKVVGLLAGFKGNVPACALLE